MDKNSPIGVFDSGIGGLTVVSAMQEVLPNEVIYYFGDTARCPYGDRKPEEVLRFSYEICDFLISEGVKMLVVACNTATAVALPALTLRYDIPVIGVIQPGARAATKNKLNRIGVIGTSVTISSGAYEAAIRAESPQAYVVSRACPKFVPLVEKGAFSGPDVEAVVSDSLMPFIQDKVDALILGCTHYPLLQKVIGRVMGEQVQLISSAKETAIEVKRLLSNFPVQSDATGMTATGKNHYFTTGDPEKMRVALRDWLHVQDSQLNIQMVSLGVPEKVM